MTWRDQLRFVRQNMKKNKVRVFMTVLATAIGCAFLILLASVGFGLHQSVIQETMQDRIVTKIEVHGHENEDNNYQPLTEKDVNHLESIEGVQSVTRRKTLNQQPTFSVDNYNGNGAALVTHFPSEIKAGLELSEGELPQKDNGVVLGYDFVESLYPDSVEEKDARNEQGEIKEEYKYTDDLIGKTIDMTVSQFKKGKKETHTLPLEIVGISEQPSKEWAMDGNVYISEAVLAKIEAFTGTPKGAITNPNEEKHTAQGQEADAYDQVHVYAENVEAVQGISEQLEKDNYATYSVVSEVDQINMIFTIMKAGLIIIGTIAILIASIGIYNTMTMAVTERAPDIGIMKAIGANPKTIKSIFLLESSYIGVIGAAIGTIVAYIVSMAINFGVPLILESAFNEALPKDLTFSAIPWTLVLISVGICLFVTILSGLSPARRATKIDVLKAMRREV